MSIKIAIQGTALVLLLSILNHQQSTACAQGNLTPPGAPAPTMKSLSQIEPRTPISSVPYTISTGGSYYLTTNLFAGPGLGAVIIQADNVTVDLNGFTLANTNIGGVGISVQTAQKNLVVRNGTIQACSGNGVEARITTGCQFNNLGFFGNFIGLEGGSNTIVRGCIAANNTGDGISALNGSTISECTTAYNGRFGIVVNATTVVNLCSSTSNSVNGIRINGTNNVVSSCIVSLNVQEGIYSYGKNRITDCAVSANGSRGIFQSGGGGDWIEGCTVTDNGAYGIVTTGHAATILNNTASGNASGGITVSGDSGVIDGNAIISNGTGGSIGLNVANPSGTNNVIIRNRCIGQFNNYVITVPSKDAQRLSGGSGFVSTDPWANFSF